MQRLQKRQTCSAPLSLLLMSGSLYAVLSGDRFTKNSSCYLNFTISTGTAKPVIWFICKQSLPNGRIDYGLAYYVAHYVWPYHETVRMSVCPSVCLSVCLSRVISRKRSQIEP